MQHSRPTNWSQAVQRGRRKELLQHGGISTVTVPEPVFLLHWKSICAILRPQPELRELLNQSQQHRVRCHTPQNEVVQPVRVGEADTRRDVTPGPPPVLSDTFLQPRRSRQPPLHRHGNICPQNQPQQALLLSSSILQ